MKMIKMSNKNAENKTGVRTALIMTEFPKR